MCLAIPAKIVNVSNKHAEVDIMGIRQRINIQLIDEPKVEQYVLVHAGFAIQTIDESYFDFLYDTLKKMLHERDC